MSGVSGEQSRLTSTSPRIWRPGEALRRRVAVVVVHLDGSAGELRADVNKHHTDRA